MQNKTSKTPNFVIFLALTAMAVVFWISSDLYRTFTREQPLTIEENILQNISPQIDQNTLSEMENRLYP